MLDPKLLKKYLTYALPAVILYIGTSWQRPLFYPFEINAAEALRSATTTSAQGAIRLGSWSVNLFGANLFAVRLPNAIAVLLIAILVLGITNACGGGRKNALTATMIYLTSFFVFAFGTMAGTGVFFALFGFATIVGIIRALESDSKPVRIVSCAGAIVALFLTIWQGYTGGKGLPLPLGKTFLCLLIGTLPWLLFVPATVKGFKCGGTTFWKRPFYIVPAVGVIIWLVTIAIGGSRLPDGTLMLGFPLLSLLMAGGIVHYAEVGDLVYANTVLRYLARIFLSLTLFLFLLQVTSRFTSIVPSHLTVYARNENYFMPVLTLIIVVIWTQMAEKEYRQNLKFLFFCIGIAFLLLALPGSIPRRLLRNLAPEPFFNMILSSRMNPASQIVARPVVQPTVAWTLKKHRPVRLWTEDGVPAELAKGASRDVIVVTCDPKDIVKLPEPKTYYRQGPWYIVGFDQPCEEHP